MGLSKEERKEAQRLEKLRAQLDVLKKLKRSELQRELSAQSKRKKELDRTWCEVMLKIKEPVFKQDIEILWQTFERAFDKKDHLIGYTMKLLSIADDQFQRTVASFCITIDTMIVKFFEDLNALSRQNEIRTANILKEGKLNADCIMTDHKTAETHLQLLLYHGHKTADCLVWSTRGEMIVRQEEEQVKYANERENLRSLLENSYNNVWNEYKAVLKAYVVETADNQKKVRKLRQKENLMADIIASQYKKIANSDEMLKKLRVELTAYESGTKQAVFRDRRNRHRAACHLLKKRLIDGCEADVNQIGLLVRATDSTVMWLENAAKKGEKILHLAALCRKLEGQREKVLPYGSTVPHSPIVQTKSLHSKQSDDSFVANAMSSTCGLTRLWQRISKAELTKRALCREKMLLEQENSYMVRQMQDFRENKIAPGSQICNCNATTKRGVINSPRSIKGILEINRFRKA